MKLTNLQRPVGCFSNECEKSTDVDIYNLDLGVRKNILPKKSKIIFVLKGRLKFKYNNFSEKRVQKGEFFLIPSNGQYEIIALNQCVILFVRLPGGGVIGEYCNIKQLYKNGYDRSNLEKDLKILKIIPQLWFFLNGLCYSIKNEFICRYYIDIKIKELLVILRAFFSYEELQFFFSLILSPNMAFQECVQANYSKYSTVSKLAESMNMTPKSFSRKFMNTFGETPQRWMAKEKAKLIYAELRFGDKSIVQIADEYGFSSQQHFNKFCQREFNKNPKKIQTGENI